MSSAREVHLDYKALGRVLKSDPTRAKVVALARRIAANVDTRDITPEAGVGAQSGDLVLVDTYTTDRAAAGVIFAHPAGAPMEAKHGTLVRAAASVGQTVRSR